MRKGLVRVSQRRSSLGGAAAGWRRPTSAATLDGLHKGESMLFVRLRSRFAYGPDVQDIKTIVDTGEADGIP